MSESLPKLLSLLADGNFHSGSDIGSVIGVSRTAVWKHLQKLADMGLSVETVKGKGYRLEGGIELLSAEAISSGLAIDSVHQVSAIDVLMQTDSTNDVAMSHALSGGNKGYVCLAEYQQSGRGRRGRQWVSPFGHNIYLSLVWEFAGGASQLEGLSLAVGVVIADVLKKLGMEDISLKWPNDILMQQRKLGGVLLEMSGDPAGMCQVVIGIGLNVRMSQDMGIDQPWASIVQQLPAVSRNDLVARLLNGLVAMLEEFSTHGFAPFKARWQSLDAYRGKQVQVISGATVLDGVANGVFDSGALCILHEGQEKAIYGGEVSLRLADVS